MSGAVHLGQRAAGPGGLQRRPAGRQGVRDDDLRAGPDVFLAGPSHRGGLHQVGTRAPGKLQRRSTGRTICVLGEPATGLHSGDIRKLLGVLGRLVDGGNTVIVIGHNLDVIKTADWVIDLGPEGG
jgi:hypothetical protein